MKNLVSIEKKKFIKKEYADYTSAYDLVMDLLDQSYFEQGDIAEMIEVCEFCFSHLHYYSPNFATVEDDVENAHYDWIEYNYNDTLPSW